MIWVAADAECLGAARTGGQRLGVLGSEADPTTSGGSPVGRHQPTTGDRLAPRSRAHESLTCLSRSPHLHLMFRSSCARRLTLRLTSRRPFSMNYERPPRRCTEVFRWCKDVMMPLLTRPFPAMTRRLFAHANGPTPLLIPIRAGQSTRAGAAGVTWAGSGSSEAWCSSCSWRRS